jgi:hypothetical protein
MKAKNFQLLFERIVMLIEVRIAIDGNKANRDYIW